MPRVVSWSPEEAKYWLRKRLEISKKYREQFEPQWKENQAIIHNPVSRINSQFNLTFDSLVELESGTPDSGDSEVGMNYAFKYMRFMHSQLSANPPSVAVKPASTDPEDRRKADAADRLVRHGMRAKNLPEKVDAMLLDMLIYGVGYLKIVWDPDAGEDVYDFNEETREIIMEGDVRCTVPRPDDIWIDPDARCWEDVRYVIERHSIPYEEAVFRFPEHRQLIKKAVESVTDSMDLLRVNADVHETERKVVIYEYYEKALPVNGMAGRHAWFLEDGTLIGKLQKNPHVNHRLPYHCMTYLDVNGQVYGKSIVEYISDLQTILNSLDSSIFDTIQAHGVVRMAIHESTEIEDESISNSSWDWIKYSGNQPPHFINPPQLPGDMWRYRDSILTAMQEIVGINDSMLGIQRREQSAVSQQTAIEAGTMIHRRLFKKYEMLVEALYKDYLGIIRENWDEPRTILVLGKEKAFEAADIKGADISGGFDVVAEYGTSLPIDPNMRREAIMLLMQPLKEAGMSMKQILKYMKLNELETMFDRMEMAANRQREVFEEMIANYRKGTPVYIPPHELEDHKGRLEYAYDYLESSEFKYLEDDLKDMIRQHVKEREELAARGPQQEGAGGAAPAGLPGVEGAQPPGIGGPGGQILPLG